MLFSSTKNRLFTAFAAVTVSCQTVFVSAAGEEEGCAHVVAATAREQSTKGLWDFSASVSSQETGWDKYADEWQVRDSSPDGTVLGTRVLLHPHETDQPFTRTLSFVEIPETTAVVFVAAHDSVLGYCGDVFELQLPGRTTSPPSPTAASADTPSSTLAPTASPTSSAYPTMLQEYRGWQLMFLVFPLIFQFE